MCQVLKKNCDRVDAKDKSLPNNSYLVTYIVKDALQYDIVICNKRADIFDMYWDLHRENLKKIEWTSGTVNPKLWGYKAPDSKKKR